MSFVRVIKASIWKLEGIPVIPINCQGVHGKGLAKEAYDRKLIRYKIDKSFLFNERVVCFPTKVIWTEKADYDLMRDSFKQFIELTNNRKELIFNLPLVGLGLGGGDPKIILPMIVDCMFATENVRLVLPVDENIKKIEQYQKIMKEYIQQNY